MAQADTYPTGLATPPQEPQDAQCPSLPSTSIIAAGLHVLSVEARAIASLEYLYRTDDVAQRALSNTVDLISTTTQNGGKLVICGIGKSGKIGQKFMATMNSLSIPSVFLHAAEAVHGDLGMLQPGDVLFLISFSGKSPELVQLLPHLPASIPRVLLTGNIHIVPPLAVGNTIFLPAPIDEPEKASFGVSAPTTSTTVALALCDAVAVATSQLLHASYGKTTAEVFARNHPGGAIGQAQTQSAHQ